MSKDSLKAKVEFLLQMLSNIDTIIQRHGSLTIALSDEIEARPAILMALMQIGENLGKIDKKILEKFDLYEDSKGSYSIRNFIAHDYEGVDLGLVEVIIREKIPELKDKIQILAKEI